MKTHLAFEKLSFLVFITTAVLFLESIAQAKFTVPELTGRVVDAGNNFTPEERERIENAILNLEESTGGQMVVATLPSLEGLTIEDVGLRLGNTWKIGYKGKDNGAILIIVVSERRMRLEVGLGWEKTITNAKAADIISGLVPFFKENRYADGSVWAVESVQQCITGKKAEHSVNVPVIKRNEKDTHNNSNSDSPLSTLLYFILLPIIVLLSLFSKKGPNDNNENSSSSSSDSYSGGGGRFGGGGASGSW